MTTSERRTELDILDPQPHIVHLPVAGVDVQVKDLKTRQFFRLMKIVTRGAGPIYMDTQLRPSDDDFTEKLLGMVVFAIPEAEEETIEFVHSMVSPVGAVEGRNLSKSAKAANQVLYEELAEVIYNPDLEDLITIIEEIIRKEGQDIQRLGKRLGSMISLMSKANQLPESLKITDPSSSPQTSLTDPEPSDDDSIPMDSSEDSLAPSI